MATWLWLITLLLLPVQADVYLGIDGGLEGSATVDNSTTYSTAQANKWTKDNADTTIAEETTKVRSGGKAVRVRTANANTARRIRAPFQSFASKTTAITIQYYRMVTNTPAAASNQVGVVRSSTETLQGSYSRPTSANTWELRTYSPSSSTFTSLVGVIMSRGPATAGENIYIDDLCMYDGGLDSTAPNSPGALTVNGATASSLDLSWGAASGGVDSGGYLVVRYTANPAGTDDPNANGIYATNNAVAGSVTGTVAYQGTGTSFTDSGLASSQAYYYKVYTYDKAYNYSAEVTGNGTTSSSASPDIAVLGTNLAAIVISNTAPAYANGTDFGGVGVNQSNVVRTYTITNSGTATLGIGSVSTSGTHAADFVVVSQPAASLAANATTTFQVRFDPSASGTRTATLTFTNNVTGKTPYPFAVQGTGVLAGVLASPASITVTTMVGTALGTQTFGVTNVGRGRLDYTITTNASWLSVFPVTAQLAEMAGQQETITFNVTGLYAGTSNATVTVDGSSTASNTATVAVSVVLTNIPDPTAATATVDGKELVRLAWTKQAAFNVLIVYQQGSAPGTPANGTSYSVGNSIPGGGTVIYSGSGAALEHVVRTNAAHYYEFYSINNNHYSPGLSASGSTIAYADGEIVDQAAYTNGVSLSGLGGGVGWTNNWSDDNPGAFTIAQYSLPAQTNYPGTNANKIVVTPPSDVGRQAYRYFTGYTGGKVYAGYKLNIQYNGANKYSGMSFMNGGTEKMFFGEMYGGDQRLGIGGSVSGSNLYAGVGNDYIVIARYDFDTDVGSVVAYKIGTDAVPASEPGTWHATYTDSSLTRIDGIRLASGAGGGSGTPGTTYFDEIRVATNWTELLRLVAMPEIAVLGTNFVEITTANTPAGGNGTDFGQTPVTGGQVDRTFFVTNSGAANLSVSGVTTSGAQAAEFIVIAPTSYPMTVLPGTASNLVIRFDPGSSGTRTAAVTVASNDSDESAIVFHVSGTGSVAATVTTAAGTVTNTTTATVGGNVTADGLAPVTNRGVVYKTTAGVTISDNKTQSGSGTGAFTANLSSLSVNTRYYFKAYAQNAAGDALGSELDFWTWANVPSAPTVGGATASSLNVTVNENGNPAATLFSILITNSAQYVQTNGTLGATEHWQTDAAWGAKTVTGLSPGQQYGFQVRAQNGQGTLTAWSSVGNGTTLANPPTVTTTTANPTNSTTATSGGNVTTDGGATVTNRGVVWAVSPTTPTVPGSQTTNGTGTGSFSSTLTNLVPGGTYTYRAFAQNSAGTSYGSTLTLTTPCFSGVVTGLTASVTNETNFTAIWSNVTGATGYALDVSTNAAFGGAASAVALQDFESSPATPTATYSASGGGTLSGSSGTGDRPASSPFYSEGAQAYEALNETATLTFDAIDTSALIDPTLSMRLASFSISSTGNGADVGDIVTVEISPNNGTTYYSTVRVLGNANAYWSYAGGTGVASTPYDGDTSPDDFQPAGGGNRTTDGYSTIIVSNLPAVSQLRIRVSMLNNSTSESWVMDDLALTGKLPSYIPGYSNRVVAGTSQSVTGLTGGVTYYFRARATNDYCTTANSSTSSVTTSLIISDIAVRGNNNTISDGDTAPTVTDHTDFGSVGLINSNVVRVYTITNGGLATLTLQNVAVTGDFTVISQPSLSIAPGGSSTFQVRFDPSGVGARSATVWITNNVTGKTPYDFVIQGTGVQAGIVRSPTSISLTTMMGTAPSAQNFGVTNVGLGQLIYAITTNVAWLSVSPVSATLGETAGQQHTVTFNVNGLVAGTSNATITTTDGNASNSPQTVTVALTLTNIPNATAVSAWADGREMTRLGWTRPTGLDVMLVHRSTNAPTAPTQGQAYNVGDVIGGNGSRIIYKGSAAQLEHVIIPGQTNHYAIYAINNNHYASGVTTNIITTEYPAGEMVEVFAYTNGGTLATSGHGGGGHGWTNSWQGDTSAFTISSGNFANISSYPTGAANRIKINSADLDNASKVSTRQFPAYTTGKVYAAYTVNFAYGGGSKYAGMSFMDDSTEELFFGEGFTGDQKLTVGGTTSASNLYAGIGNDHVVIGMYDFDADTGYVAAYKIGTDTVPSSEPATWHATVNDSSVSRINGIRLAAGGTGGGVTPGDTYFDEVRVATSWELLLANYAEPEIAVLGTNLVELTGANTPDVGNGTDFGAALVAGGQVNRTLFITNSADGVLNVSGISTAGTAAADFIVVSYPTKVSPGAVSNLVLRFDPNASGVRTATVTVVSDDTDEASYVFYVQGTGQVPATVITTIASATNTTTATAGGNVSADGFAAATNRGVVWALSAAPSVPGAQTTNGTGTGSFSSTLTNLTPGATYYYRAFAQNSAGTSYGTEYTLVTPCFSDAVTGLLASVTNVLDFTASWSNFAEATGYALDVSTNLTFGESGGGGSIYTNTWEGASKGSYASGTVAIAGITWWLHDALIGTSASDRKNGSNSARLQNSGTLGMQTSTNMGLSAITLLYAKYGTDGNTDGRVEYSADDWSTWSTAGTFTASSTTLTAFEATNLSVIGSVAVRVIKTSGGGDRLNIDDIRLYPFGADPTFVPGYSNRTVTATSQSVTGLISGATYYFRVRATNSYCTSLNSSTASVTTISLLPAMPTGLTASDGTSPLHVALSWNDVGTEDGYLIWHSLTSATNTAAILATNAANVTTYNDTSADPGQIYWYWVSATNLSGASVISASNDGYRALSAPSPVVASDGTSTNHVEVTWPGVTGANGYGIWRHTANDSNAATYVAAATLSTAILSEDFEGGWTNYPAGWTNQILSGTTNWLRASGGVSANPAAAHGGTYNARLAMSISSQDYTNRLISPALNLSGYADAAVNFWHAQSFFSPDQDLLRVYYRTSSVSSWVQLAAYTTNVPAWTARNITLPNPSADYYLAFEGVATYGYGVCLDDVAVTGTPVSTLSYFDTNAVPGQQYYYWVRATNIASSSQSDWGTPDAGYRKLATVPGVSASYDLYSTKVEVQWTDIAGETGYGIWRHTADNTNAVSYVGSVGAGVTNYADTSASVGVEYYYWVRGTNTTSSSQGDLQTNGALGRRADPNLAVVTTDDITDITPSGAKGGGNVTFGGGSSVTDRGVVWSTNAMPTTADNKSSATNGGTGAFTNYLSPLIAGQTYYVRAFASNSFALVYGSNKSFTAACFTNTLTSLYANPTNTFDFTANWPAMPGASGYRLDVSTNAIFGSFGTLKAQGFEAAPADTWGFVTAGSVTTSSTRKRTGTYSIRLDGTAAALVTFDAVALAGTSASTVTVAFSASGPDTDEDLFLSVCTYEGGVLSSNTIKLVDGLSDANIAFNATNASTVSTNPYSVAVSAAATQVYVVVFATGLESGEYYYLDDISLSGFLGSSVAGYDSRAVAGTSAAVTGLTQNTTYYYRVRPVGAGSCVGDPSSTGTVVTVAAPVIGLSSNALNFGTVAVTISSNLTLAVTNRGSANLVISSLALSGGCSGSYAVNPSSLTVLPGTESNVLVTFTPAVTGVCSATLTLNNNTPGNGAPTVSLTGVGYDPSAIVAPTNVTAVADGAEMVVLGWTKLGTPDVVVLWSTNVITATALQAGLPYAGGDNGPGDTKVAYHGSANNGIDLVVGQKSTNYFRIFGGVGTLYSTNYIDPPTLPVETLKYETGEIIDQFAYTNNATLAQNNLTTGQGWSGGWTGDTNKYQVVDTNLMHGITGFPDPRANKLFWQDTSTLTADDARIARLLGTARGGRLFVAFIMNYQYDGTEKYVGLSLMSGATADTEEIFFGKVYSSIKAAGIEDPGAPQTTTGSYNLEPGHGNDYMIVGELYPAQKTVRMWAFATNAVIPQDYTNATPIAVYSNSSLSVATITGIRLSAGSSATAGKELGHVYFDEVRVGGTWDEVLNFNYPKVYDYQVGTRISGTNYVTDGELVETGKTLAVSYTLYHRSGITNAQFTILDETTSASLYPTNVGLLFGANLAAGRQRYTNEVTNRLSVGTVDLGTYTSRVFMTASSGRSTNSIVVAETGGASDLFFGEFGEGNNYDKYVEIYNGTGGAIDLSQYLLASQTTPGDKYVIWERWSRLSATTYWLDHGSTIVIFNGGVNGGVSGIGTVDSSMTNAMIAANRTYLFSSNDVLNVSGDDPVALFRVGDTNAWVDVCGIGPSVARYIMRRVEDSDVPRSYPLQVATNQWDYRDWESDRATGYTNFLATAGVYDRNVGLGGFITFNVIDDDATPPQVGTNSAVLLGTNAPYTALTKTNGQNEVMITGFSFTNNGSVALALLPSVHSLLSNAVISWMPVYTNEMVDLDGGTKENSWFGANDQISRGQLNMRGIGDTSYGFSSTAAWIQIEFELIKASELTLSWAEQGGSFTFNTAKAYWSSDGVTFSTNALWPSWDPDTGGEWSTRYLEFAGVVPSGLSRVFIRFVLGPGYGGSSGYYRMDNIQLNGYPEEYVMTDGQLASSGALRFRGNLYDTNSGLNTAGSVMKVSDKTGVYDGTWTGLGTGKTNGSTLKWDLTLSASEITDFVTASAGGNGLPITVNIDDADNDRTSDALSLAAQLGQMRVNDDDTGRPKLELATMRPRSGVVAQWKFSNTTSRLPTKNDASVDVSEMQTMTTAGTISIPRFLTNTASGGYALQQSGWQKQSKFWFMDFTPEADLGVTNISLQSRMSSTNGPTHFYIYRYVNGVSNGAWGPVYITGSPSTPVATGTWYSISTNLSLSMTAGAKTTIRLHAYGCHSNYLGAMWAIYDLTFRQGALTTNGITEVTDTEWAGGSYALSGATWDAGSGLASTSNVTASKRPAFSLNKPDGSAYVTNRLLAFTNTVADGGATNEAAGGFANSLPVPGYTNVQMGEYAGQIGVWDFDGDRTADDLQVAADIALYVVDNDMVQPTTVGVVRVNGVVVPAVPPTQVTAAWTNNPLFIIGLDNVAHDVPGIAPLGVNQRAAVGVGEYRVATNDVGSLSSSNRALVGKPYPVATTNGALANYGFELSATNIGWSLDANSSYQSLASGGTNLVKEGTNSLKQLSTGVASQLIEFRNTANTAPLIGVSGWYRSDAAGGPTFRVEAFATNNLVTPVATRNLSLTTATGWTTFTISPDESLGNGTVELLKISLLAGNGNTYWDDIRFSVNIGANTASLRFVATEENQGLNPHYLFALDADNNRATDRMAGDAKPFTAYDSTPPPVSTGLRATDAAGGSIFGNIDEASEILVQWTPGGTNEAQAAGRRSFDQEPLAPWDSYLITYYEVQDTNGTPQANAVTSTLTRASPDWSTVFTNYAFTNLVLSNLVYDSYYRITIQGRDQAGNIGLSTSVIGNTDRFVVTQGVARSQSQLQLRWSGPTNEATYRDYDVIYADAAMGFRNALTSDWQLLQYTNRPVLTDAGGPGRAPPGQLTGTTYRFYRVARQGRWSTNQANRLASEEVYVAKAVTVNPGENWYSPFFVPDTSTVAYVFGTNILHGGPTFDEGTKITWFQPSTGGTVGQNGVTNRTVWLSSSGNWYFWPNTTSNANLYNFPADQGFLIELPTNQASRSLILVGRVPTNAVVHSIPGVTTVGQPEYHILSQNMPERITMPSFGAQLTGFQGGTRVDLSDEIRILDNTPTNGLSSGSLTKPKARIWLSTQAGHASAPWRYTGAGTPSAMSYVIEPDDAVIVVRRGTAPIAWTNQPMMYTSPNKNISP